MTKFEQLQRLYVLADTVFGYGNWATTGSMCGSAFKCTLEVAGRTRWALASTHDFTQLVQNSKGVYEEKADWEMSAVTAMARALALFGVAVENLDSNEVDYDDFSAII